MARSFLVWLAAGLLAATTTGCGGGATDEPGSAAENAQVPELCEVSDRLFVVRWAIYEDEYTEGPDEVEALMAEVDALHAEMDRLMPDEIRPQYEFLRAEFVDPIDALTAELGWSPSTAIRSEDAMSIFENEELAEPMQQYNVFMEEYCFAEEDLDTPTAPITFGTTTIDTYNSTPVLNDAITWGLERFATAGLDVPPITSVTFTVQNDLCEDLRARYLPSDEGIELEFCVDERSACGQPECTEIVPAWRAVILHEFAHAWLDAQLDAVDMQRFLDHVGLDTWRDPNLPWDEKGVEHAADTIAWGLMDRDIVMLRVGQPTEERLTEGFRILTGTDPLPRNG